MSCFTCFQAGGGGDGAGPSTPAPPPQRAGSGEGESDDPPEVERVPRFTYSELAVATRNFEDGNYLGQGGFGKVFKGYLHSGQPVAVKILNKDGVHRERTHAIKEFITEVLVLSILDHPNLVKLLGFCAENDERLLVYEYMSQSSLDSWLSDVPPCKPTLDWNTRVKIAHGAARGLLHMHETSDPQIIHRDLKSANILLDDEFNAKLCDFGLARCAPAGGKTHITTQAAGTPGYIDPEYCRTGRINAKSDVYSFGVILLELLAGRKAKAAGKQTLIEWSSPFLSDRRGFAQIADPLLEGQYPQGPFDLITEVASWCIREDPRDRPRMREVAGVLEHAASQTYVPRGRGHVRSKAFSSHPANV